MTLRKGRGEGVENSMLHPFFQTSLEGVGVGEPTGDSTSNDIMIISGYISYFLGRHHDSTVPIVLKEKHSSNTIYQLRNTRLPSLLSSLICDRWRGISTPSDQCSYTALHLLLHSTRVLWLS